MAGNILDMQYMRYINLFERVSRIRTTVCFPYNNMIVFAVSPNKVSEAIGKNASNVKEISEILRKKIKVVPMPYGKSAKDIEEFISAVVSPVEFNKFEFSGKGVVIGATMQNKAALIGRNSVRLKELEDILKRYFDVSELRIV